MSLELLDEVADFRPPADVKQDLQLKLRIGLNSGKPSMTSQIDFGYIAFR